MPKDPIFGELSHVEEMRGNAVKGNLVLSRRWYLAERVGPEALNQVINSVGPEARSLLEQSVMPFVWRPFSLLMEIDAAIIRQVMKGRIESMKEFGQALGAHDLRGIYRAFLGLTSPEFAIEKVSALGSMYFRDSTLVCQVKGRGLAEVQLTGRSMPLYMCNYGITGWLIAVLEAAKATKVVVEHASCRHSGSAVCRWECRWDPSKSTPD